MRVTRKDGSVVASTVKRLCCRRVRSDRSREARLSDRKYDRGHAVTWHSRESRRRRDRMRHGACAVAPARAARPANQRHVARLLVGGRRQRRLLLPGFRSKVVIGRRGPQRGAKQLFPSRLTKSALTVDDVISAMYSRACCQ